jgi:uncharacterized integral membrane protein
MGGGSTPIVLHGGSHIFTRSNRKRRQIMYLSLIITFLLLLVIIITAIQNSMPLDFKFFIWNFQISITALIFYSSLIGGATVAILTLPKLAKKSLQGKHMNREIHKLQEKM